MSEEKRGWIKAHRSWMNHPVIWKDADHIAVWMFLQLSATHRDRQAMFGRNIITLKPGQLITGRKAIADKTGVEQHKVDRILKLLKSAQLIEQQTNSKGRLISLLNWDDSQRTEQQSEQRVSNERATSEHLQENEKLRRGKYHESFWD